MASVTMRFDAEGISRVKRQMGSLERSLDGIRQKAERVRRVGLGLTAGITAPFAAASAAAVKAAADANEVANVFNKAFGEMSDEANRFAKAQAEALGFDISTIQKTMGIFQQMLTAMGIGADRAFEMSKGFTQLQVDIASFFNLRPEEAFQKLQSGISGEIEPLRRLGILVDQQTIQQAALKSGLIEAGQEMTQQQKVMARYQAILQQTDNIQGDFLDTQDQFTNQMRILREQVKTLAREFGEVMIPAAKDLVGGARDLVEGFSDLRPHTQRLILLAGGLAAALGPVLVVLSQMTIAVTSLVGAIAGAGGLVAVLTGPAGLIALLGTALVGAMIHSATTIRTELRPEVRNLKDDLDDLVESTDEMSEAQIRSQVSSLRTAQAAVLARADEMRRRIQEEGGGIVSQMFRGAELSGAPGGGVLGNIADAMDADVQNMKQMRSSLVERAQVLGDTITRLRSILQPGGGGAGAGGGGGAGAAGFGGFGGFEGGGSANEIAGRFSFGPGGAPSQPIPTTGFGGLNSQAMQAVADAGREANNMAVELAKSLGFLTEKEAEAAKATQSSFSQIADVAITGMGQAVQAAIQGFDNIAQIVISTVQQIVQSLARKGGPLSGLLGGFGVPLISAGLGILGAVIGGGQDRRPQPVSIEDQKEPVKVREEQEMGPQRLTVQFVSPETGDVMDEVQYQLNRRESRDATQRLPGAMLLAGA